MGDRDSTDDPGIGGSLPPAPQRRAVVLGEGDWVGRYQIVRLLGRGGMGMVYEAMQEQPRRRVALKIMDPSLASTGALRRFETEAQLLGRLDHEGIARILEAGTHREPRIDAEPIPYYAMEFISEARPITEHAAARGLDLAARLRLMAAVCDAVHHGHCEGVLHRDLKPENVVVDAQGRAKVIDFGIARVTEPELAATRITEVGQLVGTLQYMSPEQFDGYSDRLDARSDVYALGVMLYELTCGRLPYDVTGKTVIQAAQVVRQTQPPPPGRIDQRLAGELETIILKAMHKDVDRRYPRAADLAADLRRVIQGEPIEARRDSKTYIARKTTTRWMARNPDQALVAGLLLALAAVFGLFETDTFFRSAPADLAIMRRLLSGPAPRPLAGPPEHVRVIMFDVDTGFDRLARESGLPDASPVPSGPLSADISWRIVHGEMMKKLAAARPAGVLWDSTFSSATEYDTAFLAGADALAAAGIEAVTTRRDWEPGATFLNPEFEPRFQSGAALLNPMTEDGEAHPRPVWRYELAFRHPNSVVLASAPLLLFGVSLHPGTFPQAEFTTDPAELLLLFNRKEPRVPGVEPVPVAEPRKIPITWTERDVESTTQDPSSAALVAGFLVHMPGPAALEACTLRYEDAYRMPAEELARHIGGKMVILGQIHDDDRQLYTDGRVIPGTYALAATAESLARGVSIRAVAGGQRLGLLAGFAVVGLIAGWLVGASLWRLLAVMAGLLLASALATWGVYYLFALIVNPLIPALLLVICALLGWFIHAIHRRHGLEGSRA